MKPAETSRIPAEVNETPHNAKVMDQVIDEKRTQRKSRRGGKTLAKSKELDAPRPPLTEAKAKVENDAEEDQATRKPAAEKQKKTKRVLRSRRRTALVAGSHEAGD